MTKYLRATVLIASVVLIYGCTAFYQHEFSVETAQNLSKDEKNKVLGSYREFMESNGYVAEPYESERGSFIKFRIRDASSRIMPTSRITDTLAIGLDNSGNIRIELVRISSYPPDDFSEKYISDFIAITEKYMRETSGKNVQIRQVPKK